MSTPFTTQSILTYPPDDGEAAVDRTATVQGQFDELAEFSYVLSGTGTKVVDFGSIDTVGAKAIQLEVALTALQPVMVQVNSGGTSGQIEVSPGGHLSFASPTPTINGILALSLVHTAAANVKLRILG